MFIEGSTANNLIKLLFIDDKNIDIRYWNEYRGNDKSIKIKFGYENEIKKYWIPNLPLKVIIHGWLDSTKQTNGVFNIKTAYVNTGGFNVLTVDWGAISANINYPMSVLMTSEIGSMLAKVLANIVRLRIVEPKDIHLIGHSLGAHIAGACGSSFGTNKIGRITGLDPAGPGFEYAKFQKKGLDRTDALFVDVIHTSGGSTGCFNALGHADFYPNGGSPPQPGCYEGIKFSRLIGLLSCSHSRAYSLYEDSVYHHKSMIAVYCSSWVHYVNHKCDHNFETPLGHGALTSARGNFYLSTKSTAPYAYSEHYKEDL
ncbi:lipase member H-like isoform X2 [Sipha flava]|nr:lipase member H-like isoform X2 [Sipha flava]